jgi:hypothetical protein
MITRAILSLLKHNNRVNLPTLGAIIKQQDFSHSLFFNQFIRYDDGMLSTHLTKIEMLTEEESKTEIHDFIEAIREGIDREGKFEINELGVFCYVDNRLELLNKKDYSHALARSNASVAVDPLEQRSPGDDDSETPSLIDLESDEEKLIDPAGEERCMSDVYNEAQASPSFARHSRADRNGLDALEAKPQVSTVSIGLAKKTRSSRVFKFIQVTIPPIVLGLVLFRLSLPIPGDHQNAAAPTDSTGILSSDSISNPARRPVDGSQVTPVPVSDSLQVGEHRKDDETGLIYHVIIGAFRFESNADKLVAEQLIRGHTASKLVKRNGYYLVSYESTTDVGMAKKICNDLKARYPEVWLDKQE